MESREDEVMLGTQGTVILEENKEDYLKYKRNKIKKLAKKKKVSIEKVNYFI